MAIRVLVDLVHTKMPSVLFSMETYLNVERMEAVLVKLGFKGLFVVNNEGHIGGLAMLWKQDFDLQITGYSNNHIDATISMDTCRPKWRFTGLYGYLERWRRRDSWNFLRSLSNVNDLA